jgi:hypothetical protein
MKTIEQLEAEYLAAEAAYRWWSDVEEGAWRSARRSARAVWDAARERADAAEIAALDAREALEKAKSCK